MYRRLGLTVLDSMTFLSAVFPVSAEVLASEELNEQFSPSQNQQISK